MQYFKGDALEQKFYEVGREVYENISLELDEFFEGAYECFNLGDMISENEYSPLANAIPQNVFRESFFTLFTSFESAGSFEGYLSVFERVFGESVEVDFTVPAPGKLIIDITADSVELTHFIARYIENNQYVFDEIIDNEGDNIVFQSFKGLESQYELERMLFEMVPAGIFTDINLTIDS